MSLPWVRIAWEQDDAFLPREEALLRSNPRVADEIEVLTLNEGWIPLNRILGSKSLNARPHGQGVLDEMVDLLEAKPHNPFKNKKNLGPGPRGRKHKAAGKWACKCANYECTCRTKKGKRRKKIILISPSYKEAYNAQYKAGGFPRWRKKKKKKKK